MQCPYCSSENEEIIDVYFNEGDAELSEKHVCRNCGGDFVYWEGGNEWEISTRRGLTLKKGVIVE